MDEMRPIERNEVKIHELVPPQEYNAHEARVSVCLSWLLTKAYGSNIPNEYWPPYERNDAQFQLKPPVIDILTSSNVYCQTCEKLFKDHRLKCKGHMEIIQTLSRFGTYITDVDQSELTDRVLAQKCPFVLNCHLALIEALMRAWSQHLVSIERVVQAVRRFSSFNASSELPFDTEDALLFWINKVCGIVRHQIGKGHLIVPEPEDVFVPVMEDLLTDIKDGCCLCVVVSYYCPHILQLKDISLKDPPDSLYNLELFTLFCHKCLPGRFLHLTVSDLYHADAELKPSLLVLLAELFNWLELNRKEVPTPSKVADVLSTPPISQVTKQSFQKELSPGPTADCKTSQSHKNSFPVLRQPLLPRRIQGFDTENSHQTIQAWQDSQSKCLPQYSSGQSQLTGVSTLSGNSLLANVSIDTDTSWDIADSSVDISQFEQPDHYLGNSCSLELQSITPGSTGRTMATSEAHGHPTVDGPTTGSGEDIRHPDVPSGDKVRAVDSKAGEGSPAAEQLMPAQIKVAKEKCVTSPTKEVESGEEVKKVRSPSSPHHKQQSGMQATRKQPPKSLNLAQPSGAETGGFESDDDNYLTPDEDYKTPSMESVPLPGQMPADGTASVSKKDVVTDGSTDVKVKKGTDSGIRSTPGHTDSGGDADRSMAAGIKESGAVKDRSMRGTVDGGSSNKRFEAFYVDPESTISTGNIPLGTTRSSSQITAAGPATTESFILHNQHHTAETARAAGLPVVSQTGSVQSSDATDRELEKLRADLHDRETTGSPGPAFGDSDRTQSGEEGEEQKTRTSFAQIKREKENNTATGESARTDSNFSLRAQFAKTRLAASRGIKKRTTFAALPNQTTWQEKAVAAKHQTNKIQTWDSNRIHGGDDFCEGDGDKSPTSTELVDIRMRLEERRRQIESEKRRAELERSKQRQTVGKQAFIRVINRANGDTSSEKHDEEIATPSSGKSSPMTRSHNEPDDKSHDEPHETEKRSQDSKKRVKEGEKKPRDKKKPKEIEKLSFDITSKVSSAPASREHSVEREITKVATTKPLEYQKEMPCATAVRSAMTRSADSAAEMFSEGEPGMLSPRTNNKVHATRPISYHAPEIGTSKPEPSPLAKPEKPALGNYSTSLDRLNCSLSELQGEIMRLSLQQDHIKSMVVHDREPRKTTAETPPSTTTQPQSDKYYLYPRNGAGSGGEPDISGAAQSTESTSSRTQPVYAAYTGSVQPPVYGTMPSYQYTQPPAYTAPGLYTGLPPPPPPQPYANMVPPPSVPQYHPGAMYQPAHMYHQQQQHMPGYAHGHWPVAQPPAQQMPLQQPAYSAGSNGNAFPQPHATSTATIHTPDHVHQHYKTPINLGASSSPDSAPGHDDQSPSGGDPCSHTVSGIQSPLPSTPTTGASVSAAYAMEYPTSPPITTTTTTAPSHEQQQPQGFFVGFDDGVIKKRDRRDIKEKERKEIPSPSVARQIVDVSPVGFVIDDNEVTIEMSEMEKKRQRLLELQAKRRAEQEKKRLKKEEEQAKRRQEMQAKQEELERKKASERQRREAIFQEYLRRKEQDSEEEPAPASTTQHAQKRTPSKTRSKPARPKSQLVPPPAGDDVSAQPALPPNSEPTVPQDDLPVKATGHVMTFPTTEGDDSADANYQQLAFGGLTHRRPLTPERPTRLFPDNISDISSGPITAEYTGPKLFKKPSQKSNRHIIINAISHCCLAGTVNTSVKDKVLDIINNSEAKHFVILFRDGSQQFKALYKYEPEHDDVSKIFGVGPKQLTDDMMERFYKYNSGAKSFTEVTSTKHLSATIDAVVIHNHLWQKKSSTVVRKPILNLN